MGKKLIEPIEYLRDNPYLELGEHAESVLQLIDEYARSCRTAADEFSESMVSFIHKMKTPDKDFIFFLQQLQTTHRCKLGFYSRFMQIIEVPHAELKPYKSPVEEIKLYDREQTLVREFEELIINMKLVDMARVNKKGRDNIWQNKNARAKLHFYIRFNYRSAEEIVKHMIRFRLNTKQIQIAMKKHCAQEYAEYGYYLERDDHNRIRLNHIKKR